MARGFSPSSRWAATAASVQPEQMLEGLKTIESLHHVDKLLVLYGKGDHGGGPMPDMMDRAVNLMHDPNYPTVRFMQRRGLLP